MNRRAHQAPQTVPLMRRFPGAGLRGLLLLLGVFTARPAAGQSSATLRGYLEHQFSTSRTPDGWSQLDYDRFRLDLDANAGRGTHVGAAVVYQIFRGNLRPGPFDLTVGKQYLNWGRGMVFNPTELFRPKNLLEPTYEREGIGALSAKLTLGPLSDLLIAYVPESGFRNSGKVVRLRTHASGFDLSALAAEMWETALPATLGTDPGPYRRRFTLGGDLSGELLGLGVWVEGTWSTWGSSEWVELTVGGNYTLPGGTLLAMEGFYDDRGEWTDPYPLSQWLAVLTGARRTLGKGIIYGTVQHPATDLVTTGVSGLMNSGDRSMILIPNASYAYAENVDLLLYLAIAIGADGTEFGTGGHGGFLRARVYF